MTNVAKLETQKAEQPKDAATAAPKRSILMAMSERYNMEPAAFEATVRATCFPATPPATREEFAAGMQIAYRLELNPLTKEIHFARLKGGGIQGIIGIDGWFVMANRHPQYDGCEFAYEHEQDAKGKKHIAAVTCRIYRRDRSRPTEITEFMEECRRQSSEAWKLTPNRMLRHRAFGQCARVAFSYAGVMDDDEYQRWQEMKDITPRQSTLDVPDDISSDEPAAATVSEAEASQDALLANPRQYMERLSEQLQLAESEEVFRELCEAHGELVEAGRFEIGYQNEGEALMEKHGKRFEGRA